MLVFVNVSKLVVLKVGGAAPLWGLNCLQGGLWMAALYVTYKFGSCCYYHTEYTRSIIDSRFYDTSSLIQGFYKKSNSNIRLINFFLVYPAVPWAIFYVTAYFF